MPFHKGLNPIEFGIVPHVKSSYLDSLNVGDYAQGLAAANHPKFKACDLTVLGKEEYPDLFRNLYSTGLQTPDFSSGPIPQLWDGMPTTSSSSSPLSISPNGTWIFAATFVAGTTSAALYKMVAGVAVKTAITGPASGSLSSSAWSPNSRYVAVALSVTPFVYVYDLNSGSPVKLTDPATPPAGTALDTGVAISWSANSRYFAISHATTPFVSIYDMNSGNPVKITNPATLPTGTGISTSWSPDGRWLAVGHQITPFVTFYDWNSGSPVKATDPGTLPTAQLQTHIWSGTTLLGTPQNTALYYYEFSSGAPVYVQTRTVPINFFYMRLHPNGLYLSGKVVGGANLATYDLATATLQSTETLKYGFDIFPNGLQAAVRVNAIPSVQVVNLYGNATTMADPSKTFRLPYKSGFYIKVRK